MEQPSALEARERFAPQPSGRGPARRRLRLLLLLGGALVIWSGVGCSLSRRMIFPGSPTALPAAGSDLGGGAQVLEYASQDGVALRGVLARASNERGPGARPALVYFHGNAESAADNLEVARLFAAAGADVLVAEYRGYGGCDGSPSEAGLFLDAQAALSAASQALGRPEQELLLVGRSLGTGVAARLAGEGHGAGLVLISPYTSIYEMACLVAPRPLVWAAVHDRFETLEYLHHYAGPLLVLHGTSDEVIPFAMGQTVAGTFPQARFVPLPGVGHNDVYQRAWREVVGEVLALARAPR